MANSLILSTAAVPCAYSTSAAPRSKCPSSSRRQLNVNFSPMAAGLRVLVPKIQISKKEAEAEAAAAAANRSSHCFKSTKTTISCSTAQAETLQIVQTTIAKQLSIDETTVAPQTKFADLGADSLDTVEIMMALEDKFGVSIGEQGGAENIATVQDAADLIEKVLKAGGGSA